MKPLNLDNSPCSPMSSNCVIWQGPDLPCIKLCAGDTISDVVFKLATELCAVMDTLKVTSYDLACFNIVSCPPSTFQELLQFLISQICALNTSTGTATVTTTGTTKSAADTLVTVADCFVVGINSVMSLVDYTRAAGVKICGIIQEINIINASIVNLNIRVTTLETAPAPVFTLPSMAVNCNLSGTVITPGSYQIDLVLDALVNDSTYGYCALTSATGLPSALYASVISQCIADTNLSLVFGTQFSIAYFGTWVATANLNTVADAINNLWIVLCDIYTYTSTLSVVGVTTPSIDVSVSAGPVYRITAKMVDTGWNDLEGFDYYTGIQKPQARRIGNVVHFRGSVYIPLDNGAGTVVNMISTDACRTVIQSTPFTGAGGITYDASNNIVFNNDSSVVPVTIMAAPENFDDTYAVSTYNATRQLEMVNGIGVATAFLNAYVNVEMTFDKKLSVTALQNLEINTLDTNSLQGYSAPRLTTSNIRLGDFVPDYNGSGTYIHNASVNTNYPLVSDATNVVWPITIDGANQNDLGGFMFKLDGLITYLDACTIDVPVQACL